MEVKQRTRSGTDWIARGIAFFSLLVAVTSLYYSYLSQPKITMAVGPDLLVERTTGLGPRFGLTGTFANQGAKDTIITSAHLSLDSPNVMMSLNAMSDTFGEWQEDQGKFSSSPNKFHLAKPLPVRGHGEATSVLWFIPDKKFELVPGTHRLVLTVTSIDGTWNHAIQIFIAPTDIDAMQKDPFDDYTFRVSNN